MTRKLILGLLAAWILLAGQSAAQGVTVNLDAAALAQYCPGAMLYGAAQQADMANLMAPYNALLYGKSWSCAIPVNCQLCRVTIGFVENRTGKDPSSPIGPGQRIFTVGLNGETSAPIDPFKASGPQVGFQRAWTVPGFDGTLHAQFQSLTSMNAVASSVQIADALPPPNPVLTIPLPIQPQCQSPLGCTYDPTTNKWTLTLNLTAGPGTVVACDSAGCKSSADGSTLLYRALPPAGPGSCPTVGSSAIAVDELGYVYLPSPPWWNMQTGQANAAGTSTCTWIRVGPGQIDWTPNRPAGQPTAPAP